MPIELRNKISQASSFIDEAFDVSYTSMYHLILSIGLDGIALTVNEKEKNKYIAFENYTFQNAYNFDTVCDLLDALTLQSKLTNHKYKKVSCIIISNISTLVPTPLFEEDRKKLFLKFNATLEENEFICVDELQNIDSKNVFALPYNFKSKLDSLYQNITYHHYSSGLIESLLTQNKNQTRKKLYVHVQSSHFEVIVIEGKNLTFYNTFNHHSAEDFMYYLLFVCEQIQLNPESIETILLGEIERESTIYAILQKYIRTIKFGERLDGADYSYQLQKIPPFYYFTLFNNYFL